MALQNQLHRRVTLGVMAIAIAGLAFQQQISGAPFKLNDRDMAIHVANRLAFGTETSLLAEINKHGWQSWVEKQLHPESIDDTELEKRIAAEYPSLRMDFDELLEQYQLIKSKSDASTDQKAQARERNRLRQQIKHETQEAVLLRAILSKRQFNEVMVNFWRNHLSVDVNKVPFTVGHYEENVLRKYAFGKFEDLLMASAKHPAMLVFLDNHVSTVRKPNENYARELMELHTLGVDNYYTQKDVGELARVLTGWTSKPREGKAFKFNRSAHDTKPAQVLELSLDGQGGVGDGENAIRYLAHHKGTARFLATKLCKYLVTDQPPASLIDRIAEVFLESDGDLPAVYRAIILSPEFCADATARAKFKTPFDFVVSALRVTGAQVESPRPLLRELQLMGQAIYECDVPTGYSDESEAWFDPGIMVYRWNFAIHLLTGKIKGVKPSDEQMASFQKAPPAQRTRKIMETYLPGVSDRQLEQALQRAGDVKAMIAFALGSASFQQQ